MKAVLTSLCILVSAVSTSVPAQPLQLGKELEGNLSFCTTEQEAQAVVQAHKNRGLTVAVRMVHESQTCDTAPVIFTMKRIASSTKIGDKVVLVVEVDVTMADDSKKPFYAMMITPGGIEV